MHTVANRPNGIDCSGVNVPSLRYDQRVSVDNIPMGKGITGAAAPDANQVAAAVTRIKRHTQLPVAVGFGVRTAKQARAIAETAEGVVVGSALVGAVKDSLDKKGRATAKTVKAVAGLVAELAAGVRSAKRKA